MTRQRHPAGINAGVADRAMVDFHRRRGCFCTDENDKYQLETTVVREKDFRVMKQHRWIAVFSGDRYEKKRRVVSIYLHTSRAKN